MKNVKYLYLKFIIFIFLLLSAFYLNGCKSSIYARASGNGANAGNETEFNNLFFNQNVGELTIQTSIKLTKTYVVNHSMRIDSSSQEGSNALWLSSGCNIVVPKNYSVVIDGRTFGDGDEKACITVQDGGVLMLYEHAIIDGGSKNWGINVESGGQLLVESGQVCNCNRGIVVQGGSGTDLGSPTAVSWWSNTGKSVDIIDNKYGIYVGGQFRGSLIVNHTSNTNEKINFERNTYGIYCEAHNGTVTVAHARMAYNGWAIYTFGNMTIDNVNGAYNSRGIVNDGGTVDFKGGAFYADENNLKEYGIYNIRNGTVNMQGGSIYNHQVGVYNEGTINMSSGNIGVNTAGLANNGAIATFNFTGGNIYTGMYGINNMGGTVNMHGGTISNFNWGVKNPANFFMYGGNIVNNSPYGIVNEKNDSMTGQLRITGGNITGNANYDIYHEKSDSDGSGSVYGGLRIERNDTVTSKIYLAAYDNYIYTGTTLPTLTDITLADAHLERKVTRSETVDVTNNMNSRITVKNPGGFYIKANAPGNSGYNVLWTNYNLTVQHKTVDGGTLESSTQSLPYKQDYSTSAKSFNGYTLSSSPSNASGTMTGDVTVTYYYKKSSNVNVKYVDYYNQSNELTASVQLTGGQGDSYTTSPKTISGYRYHSVSGDASGTFGTTDKTVIYYYVKQVKITSKYVNEYNAGSELADRENQTKDQNASYSTTKKTIPGYTYSKVEGNANGTVGATDITVTYYYKKNVNLFVRYVDATTNQEIAEATSTTYKQGDSYTTSSKTIDKYSLIGSTNNTTGIMGSTDITVTYYYKKDSGVIARYLDKYTNEEIADAQVINELEGEHYTTTQKTIDGYEYDSVNGAVSGTVAAEPTYVYYYYKKKSNVIVKFVDENHTSTEIAEATSTIYKQGDSYTTSSKTITGYTLTRNSGNTSGSVGNSDITVTYYYKKNSQVIVNYVDATTLENLDTTTITGLEGDSYTTSPKIINNYTYINSDGATSGNMTANTIVVTYYYKKNSNVIVKYVDENTDEEIATSTSTTYKEGDSYTTTSKTINGYMEE